MAKKKAKKTSSKSVTKKVHHAPKAKNYTPILLALVVILAFVFFSMLYVRSAKKSEASSPQQNMYDVTNQY